MRELGKKFCTYILFEIRSHEFHGREVDRHRHLFQARGVKRPYKRRDEVVRAESDRIAGESKFKRSDRLTRQYAELCRPLNVVNCETWGFRGLGR